MNADVNYLGILKYLDHLKSLGILTEAEVKKVARAIAAKTGATIIVI